MKAMLGRKLGMSQTFSPDGDVIAVTLIKAEPNIVTARRNEDKDKYAAVQLALPKKGIKLDEKLPTSPSAQKKSYAIRREFPMDVAADQTSVSVSEFTVGDIVEVSGISKGKGFQGVVKRHNFSGGPASHGHRHVLRSPGSIGAQYPQHVLKGTRMAGRMGADRVTVTNLEVVVIDEANNLIAIKGAVPGPRGSFVEIKTTAK